MAWSRFTRPLVVITASVALTLGMAGTAGAADSPASSSEAENGYASSHASLSKLAATSVASRGSMSVAAATGPVSLTRFRFKNGVIAIKSSNNLYGVKGTVKLSNDPSVRSITARTQVRVNGKYKGTAEVRTGGVVVAGRFGAGKAVFGPTVFKGTLADGSSYRSVDDTKSNTIYLRRDTAGKFKVKRKGTKVAFKVHGVVRNPVTGKGSSAKRGYIQYAKKGKWKTLQKVKLNKKGNASKVIRTRSKHLYRFYVPKTSTVLGMKIKLSRKI